MLYLYSPYHLVDAFVRGAYSELMTFLWFPLIALSLVKWVTTLDVRFIVGGAFAMAALSVWIPLDNPLLERRADPPRRAAVLFPGVGGAARWHSVAARADDSSRTPRGRRAGREA